MWSWLERLIYGGPRLAMPTMQEVASPSLRTSQIFDSHIMTEAAAGKNPQAVSLAWDEGRAYGFNVAPQSWMGMTPRERKETLLSIFLANPWASNCIDTIALYITSGGYTIEPRVEKPDERQRDEIEALLLRINEGWDFNQYVYDGLTDEMIFGEYFTEYTLYQGKPYQLFSLDCLTMDTEHDRYGRVVKYKQQLTSTSVANDLDPKTIIRWWNPHKRAKVDPFSPLEGIQDAILLDKKMTNWMTTFFQKGGKFNYYFKGFGDMDEADRFLTYAKANYFGEKNAQTPPVLWGNAEIAPLGNAGPIDMSFDKGLDRMQTIVLSAFHVPPSIACIAENGNRLSDMSDGQRKILQYIACDPRRNRFFEKFNYRLIYPYFGTDYRVSSRYADFRDDETLAKVADTRIRNGSLLIDEVRQEMGKEPYADGGGDVPIIITTKEVTPVPRLKDMEDEQRQTAQAALTTAQANADLAQTKAKQAKEPPPPMPVLPPGNNGANNGQILGKPGNTPPKAGAKPGAGKEESLTLQGIEQVIASAWQGWRCDGLIIEDSSAPYPDSGVCKKCSQVYSGNLHTHIPNTGIPVVLKEESEADRPEVVQHNTGMMLAFLLDPETAAQLAIPDGEPASELHVTLAYLGDMEDAFPAGLYTPYEMPEPIKRVLTAVTSATQPLTGKIAGIGRFTTQADDGTSTPVVANVDVPGLTELRTELVDALLQANYFIADNHGYTPHITLAYIDRDAEMPIETVPPLELTFDTMWLCVGDERIAFKLGGDLLPPTKESYEEQETHPQNSEADAEYEGEDAHQSNGSLHPAQGTLAEDRANDDGGSHAANHAASEDAATDTGTALPDATKQDRLSSADRAKAELATWVATLFFALKQRGAASSTTLATALTAYAFTDQDRESLAHKLAEVNLAAQTFAYSRDLAAVGIHGPGIPHTLADLLTWGYAQAASISKSLQEQLTHFLAAADDEDTPDVAAEVGPWLDRYSAWKVPQVANYTWGSGANDGSNAAIEDMLDAATDPDEPGLISTDNIRIRIVPGESSSDFCADYAGKDYSVEDYLALGMTWPAHPNCIHSIEAYLDDENDLGGDDA